MTLKRMAMQAFIASERASRGELEAKIAADALDAFWRALETQTGLTRAWVAGLMDKEMVE